MKTISAALMLLLGFSVTTNADDLLIKVANPVSTKHAASYFSANGVKAEALTENWMRVQGSSQAIEKLTLLENNSVVYVQKNYKIKLRENPSLTAYIKNHPGES